MPKHLATAILPAKNLKSLDTETLLMVADRALGQIAIRGGLSTQTRTGVHNARVEVDSALEGL